MTEECKNGIRYVLKGKTEPFLFSAEILALGDFLLRHPRYLYLYKYCIGQITRMNYNEHQRIIAEVVNEGILAGMIADDGATQEFLTHFYPFLAQDVLVDHGKSRGTLL